jgi:hypothetical protein
MADIVDYASKRQDEILEEKLTRSILNRKPPLVAQGKCLYCAEPLEAERRFCDKYCAEDADKYGVHPSLK